jgi:hypothetical protein
MAISLPSMLIEKCAQTVDTVIIPALTDESAIMQARHAAALLHTMAPFIEQRSTELIQENRAMTEMLAKVRRTLNRKPLPQNAVWTDLLEALGCEPGRRDCSDVLEDNYRLKGLLVRTIRDLEFLSADLSPRTIRSLEDDIRVVLRQQLDHSLAVTEGFQMKI